MKNRFLSLIFFFVISLLVNISRADDHIYSRIDYIHVSDPVCVELVVSNHTNDFQSLNDSKSNIPNYSTAGFQSQFFNIFVLLDFEQSVLQKLRTLSTNNSFRENLITFLQRKNAWHQSEKDDPSII
jgi:hypothetical protein